VIVTLQTNDWVILIPARHEGNMSHSLGWGPGQVWTCISSHSYCTYCMRVCVCVCVCEYEMSECDACVKPTSSEKEIVPDRK